MANWHMMNWLIWQIDYCKSAYGKTTSYRFLIFCLEAEILIKVQSFIFMSLTAPIISKQEKNLLNNIFSSKI